MDERADRDQRLVQACLDGDSSAFGELVGGYQRLVASVAWRYGTPQDDIEDLVSEVFLKVYRNLHRFRPDHPFSTWLYRLAANHVIDHGRRSRRESARVELPEQLADPGAGPQELGERDERATLVRRALDGLGRRYREVLFLVYVEGFAVQDAARTLGLPEGTVKTRLMRGRQALRRVLCERHPEHFGAA